MSPALTSASEVGIANLPNQRHKIVSKKGTNFTLMVVGESGLGKTTFLSTLFTTTIKDYKDNDKRHEKQLAKTVDIELTKAELEERLFSVNLTVVDTPGFGDYVNNRDNWVPIVEYIDDQYENYMRQELQPKRKDIADQRVNACLYFIRPTGHTLKPLDIEAMKHLSERVNLIPVIGKADTLTPRDLESFKKRIRGVIESQGIRVYQCPAESDDESSTKRNVDIMSAMPFAVVGSDQDVVNAAGQTVKGRQYPWGVVEVENEAHCDFKKLRNLLIRTHMLDLITTTRELHYERYRHTQLELRGGDALPKLAGGPGRKPADSRFKEEEENLRRRFTEQVKAEEARFKAWEQKLIGERDRLNKDLESEPNYVRLLQDEVEAMALSLKK